MAGFEKVSRLVGGGGYFGEAVDMAKLRKRMLRRRYKGWNGAGLASSRGPDRMVEVYVCKDYGAVNEYCQIDANIDDGRTMMTAIIGSGSIL